MHAAAVESLCARLRAPNEYRELALIAARLDADATQSPEQAAADPQAMLSLLEQADALRRPERFAQWLEVLGARRRAAGRPAAETAALCAQLQRALAAVAAVQLTATELRAHRGAQIGALLRTRRLEHLSALRK
jgi:tRNA nucleotidyltransferase (CCA-adding enzyme)